MNLFEKVKRNVSILDVFRHFNIDVVKKGSYFFASSWCREDNNPSVSIDTENHLFFDFGADYGGDVINLCSSVLNIGNYEAAKYLDKHLSCNYDYLAKMNTHSCSNRKIKTKTISSCIHNKKNKSKMQLRSVTKIKKPFLIKYLKCRKINFLLTSKYLNELKFKYKHKNLFVIGFRNVSNGWDCRTNVMKFCYNKKDISFIKFRSSCKVNVFEGFFDFISLLTLLNSSVLKYDTIVLNGVNNVNKVTKILKKYNQVNSFLDNDNAGQNCLDFLSQFSNNVDNVSKRLFPSFKDVNDFLIKQ